MIDLLDLNDVEPIGIELAGAAAVARALDGRPEGDGWLCRCPLGSHGKGQGDRNPSLSVRDGDDGTLLVHCFGGCAPTEILAELRRRKLVASGRVAPVRVSGAKPPRSRDRNQDIANILERTAPLAGSHADAYLRARGIECPIGDDLRFHPDLTHYDERMGFPAMVAIVRDRKGAQVALHQTYLDVDRPGKAAIAKQKKMLGPAGGGAVRLTRLTPAEANSAVGIAEGIETGLSVATACPTLPVWSALSAGGIENVSLPTEIRTVILLVDHDVDKSGAPGAGPRAAEKAAARLRAEGRRVGIVMPPAPGQDFNDMLVHDGPEAVRAVVEAVSLTAPEKSLNDVLEPQAPAFSDDALALTFADQHAHDMRYVAQWGKWMRWDGRRWQADTTLTAYHLVRAVCRAAAATSEDGDVSLASDKRVAAVERMAKSDRRLAATADIWDADPWLLSTPGGVVDLRSGLIRPHRPNDYLTRITAVAPGGDCPTWHAFLHRIMGGDPALIAFLQRMAGYCLTGLTIEHALFFAYGTGANGKSVFLNTLSGILADHAKAAPIETFTASANDRHPTELAGLRGARLVTAVETEEGRRWAESKIKTLTGGDPIAARFMRGDFFEYRPNFKLLIAGNHKPGLRSVDEAIRRRIYLIPFAQTIPAHERDEGLTDKLKAEWAGILAWMIEGCIAWREQRLAAPEAVQQATGAYLDAEDAVATWLDECCEVDPRTWESSSVLFKSWSAWAERNGEYAGSNKKFSQNLESRGFERMKKRFGQGFQGLALRVTTNDDHDWTTL